MGGYRDETETLRARVGELEGELERTHETIARLTGVTGERPEPGDRETRDPLLNAPRSVHLERTLDFELTDAGLEAIAELVRRRHGGTVQQVGRTLTAPGFELRMHDGTTHLALTRSGPHWGVWVGASVLPGAFGAAVLFGLLHDVVFRGLSEGHVLWMAPLVITLLLVGLRPLFRQQAHTNRRDTRGIFEALVEVAHRHRAAPRARVALEDAPAEEVDEEIGEELASSGAARRRGA